MDDDIRGDLNDFSEHLEAVARQIRSTKSNITSLTAMSECLRRGAETLDTYIRIQKDRYENV